jgi:catechol 2,3-dioxygenase-like lactoylglutathione lyase family enzyme
MAKLNGVHHIAIMTADVKQQIEYFSDVLGMRLVALYWMHNVDGYFHAFMELNPSCSVAFVSAPAVAEIPTAFGVSHAGNPVKSCAAGVMQHLALNVDTLDELLAMRDRIRSRGVRVMGPLDHGFCQSIYFGGPENLVLEVSTSQAAINAEAWIDPEVVALNGISAEELARYKNPPAWTRPAMPVAQPPGGIGRPEYTQMDPGFAAAFEMSDEAVTRELSESSPPVKIASAA